MVIARYVPNFYADRHSSPPDILLLIEVSESSGDYDRSVKLLLHAKAGIGETWLVDLVQNRLASYRQPMPECYREMRWSGSGEHLFPAALPELPLTVDDILPHAK